MKKLLLVLPLLFYTIVSYEQQRKTESQYNLLKVGDSLPNVTVKTMKDEDFNLVKELESQPTIIIFYRANWCPYCTAHLSDLQDYEKQYIKLGYKIIAISSESSANLSQTKAKTFAKYILLSDEDKVAIQAFGVENGNIAIPSVFIINKDGIIKYVHSDSNYKERLSGAEVLQYAKAAL
jgi:peroxiredoxin